MKHADLETGFNQCDFFSCVKWFRLFCKFLNLVRICVKTKGNPMIKMCQTSKKIRLSQDRSNVR